MSKIEILKLWAQFIYFTIFLIWFIFLSIRSPSWMPSRMAMVILMNSIILKWFPPVLPSLSVFIFFSRAFAEGVPLGGSSWLMLFCHSLSFEFLVLKLLLPCQPFIMVYGSSSLFSRYGMRPIPWIPTSFFIFIWITLSLRLHVLVIRDIIAPLLW